MSRTSTPVGLRSRISANFAPPSYQTPDGDCGVLYGKFNSFTKPFVSFSQQRRRQPSLDPLSPEQHAAELKHHLSILSAAISGDNESVAISAEIQRGPPRGKFLSADDERSRSATLSGDTLIFSQRHTRRAQRRAGRAQPVSSEGGDANQTGPTGAGHSANHARRG